jgi:hypothetical protein
VTPQQKEATPEENAILLERVGLFCSIFLDPEAPSSRLSPLVEKLHQSLDKIERFPIQITEMGGAAVGLKLLTQPLKLKLQRGTYTFFFFFSAFFPQWKEIHTDSFFQQKKRRAI